MTTAHERKKQPDVVRRRLLDCTARISIERGLASLTIQAVADAAGVTKGGLLHHFPSKQHLVEAVFHDLLETLDADIDAAMARDPEEHGRFTRAYMTTIFRPLTCTKNDLWAAISIAMLTEPSLHKSWGEWLKKRLDRHGHTDTDPASEIARYAADGVWLADLMGADGEGPRDREALFSQLAELTRKTKRP
ncbi:MAG: TetR/AcrR family transcriptional regulator [Phyllobacterium sp.]